MFFKVNDVFKIFGKKLSVLGLGNKGGIIYEFYLRNCLEKSYCCFI